MGWSPSVIIVVRHGARLDAADKQWHLTSPTPYDPPLTYGGWNQSRAVGARIANILRSRETEGIISATNEASQGDTKIRKRRHKVIIHTSPFLRCVQTSIAISAGLAQNPGYRCLSRSSSLYIKHTRERSAPVHSSQTSSGPPHLALDTDVAPEPPKPAIRKSMLRVDAFLGEWLTPDYYDHIAPPPGSTMMVAGSKADLLRREDYSHLIVNPEELAPKKHNLGFPGGWQSPTIAAAANRNDGMADLSSLNQALPKRDRGSSLSATNRRSDGRHVHELPYETGYGLYQPPMPNYAISSSESIPNGYVAHARDACVDVDYQWDSMREPQLWGDGGEYGEEWSSMHKRFRFGLNDMVKWYTNSDDKPELISRTAATTRPYVPPQDEDTDLVLILVSHGAGCNALIGALTNQPVLLDVAMASLTMAVRKPDLPPSPMPSPTTHPSARSLISAQYDIALLASTEHLRSSTTSTPASSRTPSVSSMSAFRERNYAHEPIRGSPIATSPPMQKSSQYNGHGALGGLRRTVSSASAGPRTYIPPSVKDTSFGLWSASRVEKEREKDAEESDADSILLNFDSDTIRDLKPLDTPQKLEEAEIEVVREMDKEEKGEWHDEADDLAPLGAGASSWRTPLRDGMKRRWTVIERAVI